MMDFPDASRARRAGFWSTLRLGARMMMRDARAGELRLLVLALVVAVAAVTSVGFLADRVGRALERDAGQMLGADLVLDADEPVPDAFLQQARQRGSRYRAPGSSRPWSARATAPSWPRSRPSSRATRCAALRVAEGPFAPDAPARGIPSEGAVWVDGQLLSLLSLKIGDLLNVGDTRLRIERVVSYEPDRGMQFVNVAPRVLLRASDLPATGLIAPGSRIGYALLVAGPPEAVSGYAGWLGQNLKRGQKLATLESGRPEVRRTLDRAQRFLSLVALLAVLISAVAVALAAGRYMARHRDGIAVMRPGRGAVAGLAHADAGIRAGRAVLVGPWLSAGLRRAPGPGGGAGLADRHDPARALGGAGGAGSADRPVAAAGLRAALAGAAAPCAAGPRAAARRRHAGRAQRRLRAGRGGLRSADLVVRRRRAAGAVVAGGFLGAFLVFALVAWLCILGLSRLRRVANGLPSLRFALAGVVRRRVATITQVCALAIGLMALLLLAMTRTDLIQGWQRTLPPDAPNRFLINVQPEQRQAVSDALAREGWAASAWRPWCAAD